VRVVASIRDDGRLTVRSSGGQQSHQLSGLATANALAVVTPGEGVAEGEVVDTIVFGPIGAS
jgi:molybdopterin biosynthesis enzyme